MRFLETFSLAAVLTAAVATPVESEKTINHVEKLSARAGSATGCVQAHCTMIQETTVLGKSINYQIYWNGQKLFTLAGKPSDNLQWNGLTDNQGRKWGFKSGGDCSSLSYLNNFQSNYDYYQLTKTSSESSKHDCAPCGGRKDSCSKCTDWEAIFSDGASGYCYGYKGLSTCDFRVTC